jgi:hypothetical protein
MHGGGNKATHVYILLGGAVAGCQLGARAQQPMPVIGFLALASHDTFGYLLDAFRRGVG